MITKNARVLLNGGLIPKDKRPEIKVRDWGAGRFTSSVNYVLNKDITLDSSNIMIALGRKDADVESLTWPMVDGYVHQLRRVIEPGKETRIKRKPSAVIAFYKDSTGPIITVSQTFYNDYLERSAIFDTAGIIYKYATGVWTLLACDYIGYHYINPGEEVQLSMSIGF